MPAAALWWRLADTLSPTAAVPDRQVDDRTTTAHDEYMHASDRALVEVLAAANHHGEPVRLPGPQTDPVTAALSTPRVVAALSADHDTPELAEAIQTAAAAAHRDHLRVSATPQPDRYSLIKLVEQITIHAPTGRGPVIVVEDAAAADPDALAAVATALVPAHGRLLLIDNGQPGSARRLLDGLTLPWAENTRPAPDIEDPVLAATADRHRNLAAHRWRSTERSTRTLARNREHEQDRGHGLDID